MKPLIAVILALVPSAAGAGPFDQPWAIVASDAAPSGDANLRPVTVSRVDGESATRNRAIVAPGKRMVTVGLPPGKGFSVGTQETFELDASPCMRYHLAAKLDASAGGQWKAVVRSSETIGECLAKFKGGTTTR